MSYSLSVPVGAQVWHRSETWEGKPWTGVVAVGGHEPGEWMVIWDFSGGASLAAYEDLEVIDG